MHTHIHTNMHTDTKIQKANKIQRVKIIFINKNTVNNTCES